MLLLIHQYTVTHQSGLLCTAAGGAALGFYYAGKTLTSGGLTVQYSADGGSWQTLMSRTRLLASV